MSNQIDSHITEELNVPWWHNSAVMERIEKLRIASRPREPKWSEDTDVVQRIWQFRRMMTMLEMKVPNATIIAAEDGTCIRPSAFLAHLNNVDELWELIACQRGYLTDKITIFKISGNSIEME